MGMDFDLTPQKKQSVAKNPFDLTVARAKFEHYHLQIDAMIIHAQGIEVNSDEEEKEAVTMTAQVKRFSKEIDATCKEIITEPDKFVKSVKAFAKDFTVQLEEIEKTLKGKTGDYQYQKILKQREIEAAQIKAQAELQAQLNAKAKELGIEAPVVAPVVVPKPITTVRTESGALQFIKTKWKARVITEILVPPKFCSPDPKKLQQAVDGGIREIPGCEIYEDIITVTRI